MFFSTVLKVKLVSQWVPSAVWLHSVQSCCSTCAFLADVGQVVVAGHVVPLAILMGNGHHAVLTACKEVIRLTLPPVLIYLLNKKQHSFHLSTLEIPTFSLLRY